MYGRIDRMVNNSGFAEGRHVLSIGIDSMMVACRLSSLELARETYKSYSECCFNPQDPFW